MIGVNGWCSANHASPAGIESVGTKPLERNGSRIRGIGALLAASTLPRPGPARRTARSGPSPSGGAARGAEPSRRGRHRRGAERDGEGEHGDDGRRRLTTAASPWPVSGADRAIGMVRNRSMIPSVRPSRSRIAVLSPPTRPS